MQRCEYPSCYGSTWQYDIHLSFCKHLLTLISECCSYGTQKLTNHNITTNLFDEALNETVGATIGCTWARTYFDGRGNYLAAQDCIEKETQDNKTMLGGGTWGKSGNKPSVIWSYKIARENSAPAKGLKLSSLLVGGLFFTCMFAVGLWVCAGRKCDAHFINCRFCLPTHCSFFQKASFLGDLPSCKPSQSLAFLLLHMLISDWLLRAFCRSFWKLWQL